MATITATNKHTGEIVDLTVTDLPTLIDAWNIAREYEKVSQALKDQLKKLVPQHVYSNGTSEEHNGYMFRVSQVQRKNYDKTVMREVLDADTYDLFVKPDKPALDRYLKENLESLGEASTLLRQAMIPEGNPYEVIKLEKLK